MDLREALNAVSDVIVNRPPPLREFDQIYMKAADMLIQADHVSKWFTGRDVVFIGDGDALALSLVHLHRTKNIDLGPRSVHVLDFDERVVNSILRFAERYEYEGSVTASLYNVAEPLPREFQGAFSAFYTNPPFGASNEGRSVSAFIRRGFEATAADARCCIAIADYEELAWCDVVLARTQDEMLRAGFVVAEMIPRLHRYHLDDLPDLTSCSLVGRRRAYLRPPEPSQPLTDEERAQFYGRNDPLRARYVRDLTNGGKLASKNHVLESFRPPAGAHGKA